MNISQPKLRSEKFDDDDDDDDDDNNNNNNNNNNNEMQQLQGIRKIFLKSSRQAAVLIAQTIKLLGVSHL